MSDNALHDLAAAHGVHADFHDLNGAHHPASPETLRALLAALGVDAGSDAAVRDALACHHATQAAQILPPELVLDANRARRVPLRQPCTWVLQSEAGDVIAEGQASAHLDVPGVPVGYYLLNLTRASDTQQTRILVRPSRAPDVVDQTDQAQCCGVTAALYGLRSDTNGGLGNYADLGAAAAALGRAGADFLGVNPIHALGWAAGDMISPYSPTHRGFFNIDHIATQTGLGATPADGLIDYGGFRTRHRKALQAEYAAFTDTAQKAAFDHWHADQGDALRDFTQFEALSARHGRDFRRWPAEVRAPGRAAQQAAGAQAAFHAWLQWRAETQIAQAQDSARHAGMALGLYLDLAVGPRPDGAEVWMNSATIAKGVTIGAPPDQLSPEGQSWTLAAHAPGAMSRAFYRPLREMLRKLMARCGLLRIDHALGLLRSFWLPDDGSPGGYISQPFDSLLAVIAIEADRAGCVVVGEDLGLVPDGFRAQLNAAGLYSYAVWQYEASAEGRLRPAEELPPHSLACFGTHDTPTLQGFWYGADIDWWQRVGWLNGAGARSRHNERSRQRNSLRAHGDMPALATPRQITQSIHHALAKAPSALLAVQLDDALGVLEAQNLPGTIDEHPNWRRRCPVAVEDLDQADLQLADRVR